MIKGRCGCAQFALRGDRKKNALEALFRALGGGDLERANREFSRVNGGVALGRDAATFGVTSHPTDLFGAHLRTSSAPDLEALASALTKLGASVASMKWLGDDFVEQHVLRADNKLFDGKACKSADALGFSHADSNFRRRTLT